MMNNVLPFVPRSGLAARASLNEFVNWAKSQIHLYDKPSDPVQWGAISWSRWGINNTRCSKLGKRNESLDSGMIDYVKAMLFEERVVNISEDNYRLNALRCLEKALLDINKEADIISVTAAIFDRATLISQEYNSESTAYSTSLQLKRICDKLIESGMVAKPFIWDPQVKEPKMTLRKSAENAEKKLPSFESIAALGDIFSSNPESSLDIMVTSAVAILLSQPSRVGELSYIKKDCFVTDRDEQGRSQLYMLWYSQKGFGANRKIIPDSMAEICKEAVGRIVDITNEAREYARWLEENPDDFPHHLGVPKKHLDAPLTMEEVCKCLMLSTKNHSPRNVFKVFIKKICTSKASSGLAREVAEDILSGFNEDDVSRVYVKGRLSGYEFNDTFVVTLRKLNLLVREKYLPKHFPYTDSKKVVKWKDALFCFRSGTFSVNKGKSEKPFGITGMCKHRLSTQLTGTQKKTQSIFERYGYSGVKVNTHAFRHLLNTVAQRGGLSQELIARWSGRLHESQNWVYNHVSPEEMADKLEVFLPQVVDSNILASIKTNVPIRMKDVGGFENRIVHRTEFGVCVHDYAQEPCAKFNNCLTCGEHICVKGDDVKLLNLKDERGYLRRSLVSFKKEAREETYGANTWLETTIEKLERCEQLIKVLEDPTIEDGALVKGVDNSWTAGCNALSIRGELGESKSGILPKNKDDDRLAELERILGLGD